MPSTLQSPKMRFILLASLVFLAFVLTITLLIRSASAEQPASATISGPAWIAAPASAPTWLGAHSPSTPPAPYSLDCGPDWVVVPSPNVGTSNDNFLYDVARISSNDVWAVGYYNVSGAYYTLTEHWDGTNWTAVASPQPGPNTDLIAVTSLSSTDVWAAGSYGTGNTYNTLVEHWDGSTWSVVPSPNVGTNGNGFNAVTAISSTDVWAVGGYSNSPNPQQTLIEHWDGSTWSVVSSPNVGMNGNYLTGISAAGANDVWAVGGYEAGNGYQTLAEHWDGSTWSVVSSPNPTANDQFYAVTALATNNIWAVGYSVLATAATLVEHWDGSTWSVVSSPNPGSNNFLVSVSAAGANDVWAVGYYNPTGGYTSLIEHWNGTSWSVVPNPSVGGSFSGVAAGADDVWAVGDYGVAGVSQTLVERYSPCPATPTSTSTNTPTRTNSPTNTSTPTITSTPTSTNTPLPTQTSGGPTDTAQPTGTITSTYTPTLGPPTQTLVATNTSTDTPVPPTATPTSCTPGWNVISSPNQPPSNYLNGIAAAGPSDVWAVGYFGDELGVEQTLIEHWDGSVWSIVPSPNPGTSQNFLNSVAAASPNDVWAVGHYNNGGTFQQTLIEHWNGSAWSIVPSPSPGTDYNYLRGVAVVGTNNVWAVGDYYNGTVAQTLVEHWNGSAWSIIASPNQGTAQNYLYGVAVASPSDVWAVGNYFDVNFGYQPLTEHWNGSIWTVVPSFISGQGQHMLNGVAIAGADDVWAVGYTLSGQTLIVRWNGSAWSTIPSPSPGTQDNALNGVAVAGANDVWAVGYYQDVNDIARRTLIVRWNGSTWSTIPSPSPGMYGNELNGVAITGANDVWAAGYYDNVNGIGPRTLIESYTACEDPPTSTPAPPTPTSCYIQFSDAPYGSTFYPYIRCMACRGIINGYPCGGPGEPCNGNNDPYFRPSNNVTRGQFAKIASNAAGFVETPGAVQYEDVGVGSTFYDFIWRLSNRGLVTGYSCGRPDEPCGPNNLPYFRPNANITRGQIAKIDANAAGYNDTAGAPQYEDVAIGSTFYDYIWRLANRGLISGYPCGGVSEPCGPSALPYFRPGSNATRGQASKIVSNTFFPNCQTPVLVTGP